MARLKANLAAIEVVRALRAESRAATPAEQEILAGWSGWGAVKAVFREKPGEARALTDGRQQLRALLTDKEYAAARRNTVNAHYTGTALARAMWDGLAAFGFGGGRVLEPGCGSGNFIGLAPLGTAMVGIELDPVTAHVAAALYPHAQIRNESFADTELPEGSFDAAIGNVPFGKIHLGDPRYNPERMDPIHTHFIGKSAALVRPGGLIALITSRHTLDGTGEDAAEARRRLARLGELAAAVRLPSAAHRRAAGTDVVTDVLVIRRYGDGEQPPPGEPAWIQTVPVDAGGTLIPVNRYFAGNPGMVLGELAAGGARGADDLQVIAPASTDVAAALARALAGAATGRAAPAPRPATPSPVTGRPPEGYQQARPDGTFARMTGRFFEPFDPPGGPAGQAELRALLGLRNAAIALLDAELATTEDAGLVDGLRADLNTRYDAYVTAYGPVNRYNPQVKIRSTPEGRALREQLLAEGQARFTGGKLEISDPAVRDRLVAAGHATVTETGELRSGRTRAARDERQRLLDSGQARALDGTFTLTEAGRARVLENAADMPDAVTIIRARPAQGGFRNDPFAVRVMALEKYDPETGTARKTDIMRHRVLLPRPEVEHAENPQEALAICMDRHGQVRLDVIAELLGAASEQDARDQLGMLVYHDPAEGRLVPAQEYLSGDVRLKLRQAKEAAADDPACQANIEALTEVIPADLGPAEIEARLGAVFITPAEVQQFLRETLADASVTVTLHKNGTWSVDGGDWRSVAARLTWGTKDCSAHSLAEHLLNRKGPVTVTRTDSEGKTWVDEEATQAAREKQAELADRFAGWAWEDLDRAGEICRRYNDAFNAIVLRSYDDVQLSLPGVNRDITLHWWQKAAIARMICEPTAGLFHDMGAGKTLEQIIGVMEQRRLGLIRKPVICVKNHLLDQFRDEFLWAYPQARILCADTPDLEGDGRRQFIARCAAENPDAIIMTRGAFEAIPLTPEGHEAYLDYMKDMFTVHAAAVTESVADEEILLAEFEEKLREYFDPDARKDEDEEKDEEPGRKRRKRKIEQDPAMCWEQTGADYICVDESQDFNNLWTPSNDPGMAIGFVHRSIDLEMKFHATRRRYGSRAGALATGTPVTNKITQFYVLQRYLRPERLQAAGFAGYAPWAATYSEAEQRLEMKADGGFSLVTRMRLINFPELLLDLHYFGDFKDADDIGLKRPAISGGKPEIRGNPAVPELTAYQSTLPERYREAKGGRKEKGDDTVVAVIGDGFRAAQDLRLVKGKHGGKPSLTDEPQKIDHIADDVYAEWLKHRHDVYPGEDGPPDPVTGSLQLVFCNEGVPDDDWNLYDELRNLLIERGMPRSAIRFIHDAGSDGRKKAALFSACNAGHVAVLIGSTEKMGVGTNVQRRCIGIHHVHPHWRPDYDAQEDARARRPGNLNTEVFIRKWITEGSFDTIRAQACERKSVFLRVIKHRDTSVRSIEAPGDDTVSYAEIAAVGAGEPRLIQKAQLESELQQLARAQRRHLNNQNALKVAEQQARASITAAEQTIRDIDATAGRVVPTAGDAFSMTVDGTTFTARREAGDQLITCLRSARARVPAGECHTTAIGTIGGFQLTADLASDGREHTIVMRLADLPGGVVQLDHRKLPAGIGLVTRLENRLAGLDKMRLEQQAILDRQRQEITRAQSAIGTPFPQQDDLIAAKKALDDLVTELRDDKNNKDGTTDGPAAPAAGLPGTQDDDTPDISPATGTRPARPGGPATTNTTRAPSQAGDADRRASAALAAVPWESHGTGTDWTTGHPFSAAIATLRQAALADHAIAQVARSNNTLDRFLTVFRPWADNHVAGAGTSPGSPLPPFAAAYFDDPLFAADLTATLAARVHQSVTGTLGPADPSPDPDATADAARAVAESIERGRQVTCACSSGCDRCRLPGDRAPDLAEAVRISIRLSRAGMPRQRRVITWDQPSASYIIECPVPDGGAYRLIIPPEGEQIRIRCPDGSDIVPHRLRGDPDAAEYAARAYAEATRHTPGASTAHRPDRPAASADPGRERAERPGSPHDATAPEAAVSPPGPPAAQVPATAPPAPGPRAGLLAAVLGGYTSAAELAAAYAAIERAWQAVGDAGFAGGLPAGRLRTQYYQLEAAVSAAQRAPDTSAALEACQNAGGQAAQLGDAATQPGEHALGHAARQLSAAADAHLARLTATGPAADDLLNAAAGLRQRAGGEQSPDTVFPDPLGLHPEPYQDSTEVTAARTAIFQLRDTWLEQLDGAGLPASASRLNTALERLERNPDRSHLAYQRASWDEAVSAALDAFAGPSGVPAADQALPGLLRAVYDHRQRLDAYRIQAGYAPAPYKSPGTCIAGLEETEHARQAWQATQTGTRLRELTDRQARGTHWWDIRLAASTASSAIMVMQYPAPAADELATTARQSLEAADAYHTLLLNFASADYASPADHQRLDAVIRAAYHHAARIQASRDTGLGPEIGAALAERAAPKPAAPAPSNPAGQNQAAAPEPAGDPAAGLVIEHHQQGTLIHGTQKNDHQLRRLLGEHGFRWSRNLNAWYLPRPWTFSTRNRRVSGLAAGLRQADRSFTMRSQPPAPEDADGSPPEPLPTADPYTDVRQARRDHLGAVSDYWALTRTPAGNNVMAAYPESGARPDALALNAAYKAVPVSWDQAFAGDPHEVAGRFTAWVHAASTLSRNLAAEQHRAPAFRQTLGTFIGSATRLASRTQATAQDRAAWARVFAGVPGNAAAGSMDPEQAVVPDPALPAAGRPGPGILAPHDEPPRQGSDKPVNAAAPPVPGPEADALPGACRSADDLRQLAAAYGLGTSTGRAGPRAAELTVVHDNGRTVLLHDDISGTTAGGHRLDPGEVPAYLAAYASHPQLPARCLADLIRADPAAPGTLTLTGAREIAARHDLDIRIRRSGGQAYITFREPGIGGPPVLSYPAGTGSARHGPCEVPVAAIGSYLATYRASVPAAMFAAPAAGPRDWARRVAQLTPHLIDGGGHFLPEARDHLRAAITAARGGDTAEAGRLLSQAEALTPPLTPAPEREAGLVAVISQHAARYGHTDDPAGYMAQAMPPLLDASDREWDWVRSYISAHPEVRQPRAHDEPAPQPAPSDDRRQQAASKSRQAKTALENGDFEQALALLDEAELLHPDHGISYGAARDQVRAAMNQTGPGHPHDQDSTATAAPAAARPGTGDAATAGTATDTAALDSPADGETTTAAVAGEHHVARPPGGTQPLATHAGWAGNLRPERLLYADGTPLRIRGQGDDDDQVLPATAAGVVPAPDGSEYGPGRLQVVRWADGRYAIIHPALASPAGIDAYAGLSDRDRARWEVFDLAEAWPVTTAGLPPYLVDAGDVLQVERGPRSRTMDLREVQSVRPGTGTAAGGLEFTVTGIRSPLFYPPNRRVLACIPQEHPSLPAAIQAALAAAPDPAGTADPAPDRSPGARAAAGSTASRVTARAAPQPGREASAPRTNSRPGTAPQAAAAAGTGIRPAPGEPAGSGEPEPGASPLTNSDLADGLRRLPGFAPWLSRTGPPGTEGAGSQHPGEGASVTCDARGIEITVSGPGFTRHGLVTWPQAASWIDTGVTPARLGLLVIAGRLSEFCRTHRGQLTAAGTCDPDATAAELGQIRDNAAAMIVDAALHSRGAAAPVPPARPDDPAWHTAVPVTRPDRTAGKAENAALERLTRLRTMIREPQPATPAEIRATIRRWTGYLLPDLVRALDDPAAMRAWIGGQASRPVPDGYDGSGERWYGSSADGLITDRSGDDRAPALIRWEEIPAWIQPGITSSLRDRLLAADDASQAVFRRRFTAAAHPHVGIAVPSEEQDKQATRRRTEAVDAAWAAIEAAPPPAPAGLDHARHLYRDTSPVQQTLFDDPPVSARTPDRSRATSSGPRREAPSGPAAGQTAANPAAARAHPAGQQQDPPAARTGHSPAPALAAPAGQDHPHDADTPREAQTARQTPATAPAPAYAGPADDDDPEPPQTPATNSDLAIALHHISAYELTEFLTAGKTSHHGSRGWRRDGRPDAGASEDIDFDRRGIEITLRSRRSRRHGLISWRQAASWIDTGLTPARLGIIIAASRTWMFTYARRDQLIAAGKDGIDAAITELSQISNDAFDAAVGAALSARDADAPVPPARPGKPAYRTTAMLTRPDPSASAEENAALVRIAELESAIRGAQPCTPADIKATIRWWIGDSLPEYARALASPDAMRAWVSRQASGPASRPGTGSYDSAAGRYYRASPEGLRTGKGSDTRTPPFILWEEIPAWIQPGLPGSLRGQLAAAAPRPAPGRTRKAAAPTPAAADIAGQAGDPLPRPLREAVDAAWAAIDAAPPPSPAELDHARTVYRGTGTPQQPLPGSPASTGRHGRIVTPAPQLRTEPHPSRRTGQAAHRQDELPAAAPASTPAPTAATRTAAQPPATAPGDTAQAADTPATAEARSIAAAPARQQTRAPAPASADGTPRHQPHAPAPAESAMPDPGMPLTDDDICAGLSTLPSLVFTDLFAVMDGQPMNPATRLVAPFSGRRAPGEPGSVTRETVTASPDGLRIQAGAADGTRAGLLPWPQAARWVQPGLTPARRQVIEQATRTALRFAMAHVSFRGAGEASLAAAAERELRALAAAAVTATLDDARAARGSGQPPRHDVAGGAAALARIADLAAALPDRPPQPRTPVRQVRAGDIIGHPGYRLQPFLVAVPPRDRDGQIEITGRLTDPSGGEPAGQITLTLPRAGHPDPIVYLIPAPARSLRPLAGGTTAADGGSGPDRASDQNARPGDLALPAVPASPGQPAATGQHRPASPAPAPGTGSAAAASTSATAAPGTGRLNGAAPLPGIAPPRQENTMPPVLPVTPLPAEEPAPAARLAPAAGPAPAAGEPGARPAAGSQAHPDGHAADQPADDARLLRELDQVLAAILERRRAAAAPPGADGASFADVRAAFAVLRSALDLPRPDSNGNGVRPATAASVHAAPAAAAAQHGAPGTDDFGDIRAAFASLRDVLGLPAPGSHARPGAPEPDAAAGPDTARMLDQAAAEAHACARWYRDTPEWQRMNRIGRSARDLLTTIREAAADYWAEIRLDVRVRGFARTLAARVSLAVSGAAHLLAGRLDRAGHRDTRPWRAAWRLHQATATFANRVMNYTPPGSRTRMDDARRLIDDLGRGPRRPGEPGPSPAVGPPGGETRSPGAAALGRESFPVLVSRENARQAAAPAARAAAAPPPRQAQPAARP